jgi:hypothetical protein
LLPAAGGIVAVDLCEQHGQRFRQLLGYDPVAIPACAQIGVARHIGPAHREPDLPGIRARIQAVDLVSRSGHPQQHVQHPQDRADIVIIEGGRRARPVP